MDNQLKIINYLGKNIEKSFTMHELSKILNIPYATFFRTVKQIEELLIISIVGKAKTLRINHKNPIIKSYLAISSEKIKQEYLNINPLLKQLTNQLNNDNIVVLFGSYANNKQRKNSDIDLIIINKKGNRTISFSEFELLHKKKVNPIFITGKEFELMLNDKYENVGKQALGNHIILNQSDLFWKRVLDAKQGKISRVIPRKPKKRNYKKI